MHLSLHPLWEASWDQQYLLPWPAALPEESFPTRQVWGRIGIIVLSFAVILFTYSSYIGFFVEFRTCIEYLFGVKAVKFLQFIFLALPVVSATLAVEQVWDIADMAVGFIVIPNMIALLLLSPKFVDLFRSYIEEIKKKKS